MVRVTEELLRKRAEHNELIIGTLEELSLHQDDIEKIEHIQNWCPDLKILLMHSNLISKIENLHKLKKLEYLNLGLNNIEIIENLEQLESLTKLDLTLNFIGNLQSVENLRTNYNLRELILTGNSCSNYNGYRNFVIATLPQLKWLDGVQITHGNRIIANQEYKQCRQQIIQQQIEQQMKRDEQKLRVAQVQEETTKSYAGLTDDEINERFWKERCEHCPETRIEMAKQQRKRDQSDPPNVKKADKPKRKLFTECGRPYSCNEPKLKFDYQDLDSEYILNLHVYKYMDTSLIDVDAQPNYVRVTIKGSKVFQLALNDEIRTSDATIQRSLITGHLLIKMPKLHASNVSNSSHKAIDINIESDRKNVKNKVINIPKTEIVDYKHIIRGSNESTKINESEIPPLC